MGDVRVQDAPPEGPRPEGGQLFRRVELTQVVKDLSLAKVIVPNHVGHRRVRRVSYAWLLRDTLTFKV
jgi:hypothetical protein